MAPELNRNEPELSPSHGHGARVTFKPGLPLAGTGIIISVRWHWQAAGAGSEQAVTVTACARLLSRGGRSG
jgi:hypothetical protein